MVLLAEGMLETGTDGQTWAVERSALQVGQHSMDCLPLRVIYRASSSMRTLFTGGFLAISTLNVEI